MQSSACGQLSYCLAASMTTIELDDDDEDDDNLPISQCVYNVCLMREKLSQHSVDMNHQGHNG